jgi:hypothetical protein
MTEANDRERSDANIAIGRAEAVAEEAFKLRKRFRATVSPSNAERQRDIERAIEAINVAAQPVRSAIGRSLFRRLPSDLDLQLRAISQRLQYERKQLKKMRR